MKLLLLSVCLISSLSILQANEPDLSEKKTYEEICFELLEHRASYLDLRISKANMLLNSPYFFRTHDIEFPELTREGIYAEYKSPVRVVNLDDHHHNSTDENNHYKKTIIVNLICEVSSNDLLKHYTLEERLMTAKMMYVSFRDLAKKEINPLLTDQHFEVFFYVSKGERINGIWHEKREQICKWSNGEGLYYDKFLVNEERQDVCDRNIESGLTEQEVLKLIKN